jgi:hypothetical protein
LDAFGKIFESYSIEPPEGYSELVAQVEGLGDQAISSPQVLNLITEVIGYLFYQFLISAQAYLAACVIGVPGLSNGRDLS